MAEINIEKDKNKNKGGSNIWLWVIGILVLVGIIWWIAAESGEEEVQEAEVYEQRISLIMETAPMGANAFLVENFQPSIPKG